MNPFESIQNDAVFIENRAGERAGPYKTAIGSNNGLSASIFDENLDVEEGWKLIRPLPSGKEECYTILETNYSPGLHTIPPHWKLKLRKDTSLANPRVEPHSTTINITNSQGIQIGNQNIQHIANSLSGLVKLIESSDFSAEDKQQAKGLLRRFLENPSVAAVLGAATSGVLDLLP